MRVNTVRGKVRLFNTTSLERLPRKTKSAKHKNFDAVFSDYNYQTDLDLLDLEIRSVAGHVTRRSDRVECAEPPPPPPPSRATTVHNSGQPRRQRRRRTGLNDGSGSDSDSNHDDHRQNGDTAISATKSQQRPQQHKYNDSRFVSEIVMGVIEWINRVLILRSIKEYFGANRDAWLENQRCRKKAENMLLDERREHFYCPVVNDCVISRDRRLHEYLYKNLNGITTANGDEPGQTKQHTLEEIVMQVEEVVLALFPRFDPWPSKEMSLESRLECTLKKARDAFSEHCFSLSGDSPFSRLSNVYGLVNGELLTGPPMDLPTEEGRRRALQAAAFRFFSLWPCTPTCLEGVYSMRRFVKMYRDNIVTWMIGKILIDTPDETRTQSQGGPKETLLQRIGSSRQNGHLTSSYIEWVLAKLSPLQVDILCTKWQKWKTMVAPGGFHDGDTKPRQQFVPRAVDYGNISLVRIKGSQLLSAKEIPREQVESLGWFHGGIDDAVDDVDGPVYWRCEPVSEEKYGPSRDILKVSMNGEIFGAFCRKDLEWAFLPLEIVNGIKLEVSRPRPLNKTERRALGLLPEDCNVPFS